MSLDEHEPKSHECVTTKAVKKVLVSMGGQTDEFLESDLRKLSFFKGRMDHKWNDEDGIKIVVPNGAAMELDDLHDIIHIINGAPGFGFRGGFKGFQNTLNCLNYFNPVVNDKENYLNGDQIIKQLVLMDFVDINLVQNHLIAVNNNQLYIALKSIEDKLMFKKTPGLTDLGDPDIRLEWENVKRKSYNPVEAAQKLESLVHVKLLINETELDVKTEELIPSTPTEISVNFCKFNDNNGNNSANNGGNNIVLSNINVNSKHRLLNIIVKLYSDLNGIQNGSKEFLSKMYEIGTILTNPSLKIKKILSTFEEVMFLSNIFLDIAICIQLGLLKNANITVYQCLVAEFQLVSNFHSYNMVPVRKSQYYKLLECLKPTEKKDLCELMFEKTDHFYHNLREILASEENIIDNMQFVKHNRVWTGYVTHIQSVMTSYHMLLRFCVSQIKESLNFDKLVKFNLCYPSHKRRLFESVMDLKDDITVHISSDTKLKHLHGHFYDKNYENTLFYSHDKFNDDHSAEWLVENIAADYDTLQKFNLGIAICKYKFLKDTSEHAPLLDWTKVSTLYSEWCADVCGLNWFLIDSDDSDDSDDM